MYRTSTIDMFTPERACEHLVIDDQALLAMVNSGQLPAYNIGGSIRFKVTDVAAARLSLANDRRVADMALH